MKKKIYEELSSTLINPNTDYCKDGFKELFDIFMCIKEKNPDKNIKTKFDTNYDDEILFVIYYLRDETDYEYKKRKSLQKEINASYEKLYPDFSEFKQKIDKLITEEIPEQFSQIKMPKALMSDNHKKI